jgi:PAS domain S-box-containing protein
MIHSLIEIGNHFRDSFTIVDMGTPSRPCVYVNKHFCDTTGFSYEESVGRNLAFLQGPLTSKETVLFMRRSFENEIACVQDIINYKRDGSPYLNRLLMLPVRAGNKLYYLGFQNDVTLERGLVHNNDSLSKVKDREIRHMINNPLAIIIGKLQLSLIKGNDLKGREQLIQSLEENFLRINQFARDIENLSEFDKFEIA